MAGNTSKSGRRVRCELAANHMARLKVVQQPQRARMCGFGDKVHMAVPS
jgi:hypothetical protein